MKTKEQYIMLFVLHISANPWFVELEDRSFHYQGLSAVTKDGVDCQRWDAHTPHEHDYTDPRYFPDATVEEAGNYCRRMDERWPWCYTMSGTRWEWCGKLDLLCTTCKYVQPLKCC